MYLLYIYLSNPRNLQCLVYEPAAESVCWCWSVWMHRASTQHSCAKPLSKAPTRCSLDSYHPSYSLGSSLLFQCKQPKPMTHAMVILSHCWPTTLMRRDKISLEWSSGAHLSTKLQLEKRNACVVGRKRGGGESGLGYVRLGWLLMWCGQQPPEHQFAKTLIIGKVLISADGLCNSESHDVTSQLILLVLSLSLNSAC